MTYGPDTYDAEADWLATGSVVCDACQARVKTPTLETLPPHGCAPPDGLLKPTEVRDPSRDVISLLDEEG